MSHTVTTDDVHNYLVQELSRHTVQGNTGELRHIRRVAAFLGRVADDLHDGSNKQRFQVLFDAASRAMDNQPIDRSDRV